MSANSQIEIFWNVSKTYGFIMIEELKIGKITNIDDMWFVEMKHRKEIERFKDIVSAKIYIVQQAPFVERAVVDRVNLETL